MEVFNDKMQHFESVPNIHMRFVIDVFVSLLLKLLLPVNFLVPAPLEHGWADARVGIGMG